MAKIDEAKRAYWNAKVKEAQMAIAITTNRIMGKEDFYECYPAEFNRDWWRRRNEVYRSERRRIMAVTKL